MKKIIVALVILSLTVYAQQGVGRGDRVYNLVPIAASLVALYLLSLFLAKKKVFSPGTQRKMWNMLLAVSFIVVGATGLLIAARSDLGLLIHNTADLVYWHYEFGIAMTFIALFHALWHWKYFLSFLGRK